MSETCIDVGCQATYQAVPGEWALFVAAMSVVANIMLASWLAFGWLSVNEAEPDCLPSCSHQAGECPASANRAEPDCLPSCSHQAGECPASANREATECLACLHDVDAGVAYAPPHTCANVGGDQ